MIARLGNQIRSEVVERILSGQAIAVAMADLFESDHAFLVKNEGRRIGGLSRRIPP